MAIDLDGFIPATGAPAGSAFYNSNRDAPVDPLVPALLNDTGDLVREYLDLNQGFAQDAMDEAVKVMRALSDAVLPSELPSPPPAPLITTTFSTALSLGLENDVDVGTLSPEPFSTFAPLPVTIPNIEADLPTYQSLGLTIVLPDAPTLTLPDQPDAPSIDYDFTLPSAPTPTYGGMPDLDEIVLPTYTAPVLPVFNDDAPEFDVLPPEPFIQWQEPQYSSSIKDAVEPVLREMLAGGTGIPADIENAIWERAVDRDQVAADTRADAAIALWAARGFTHPQGPLNGQILAITEESERKANELSRERAVTQSDLEQKNRQFAVEKSLTYEQIFVGIFLAVVERNFQIAKFAVETQIQIYNLRITAFNVEQQVYTQKIAKYRVDLDTVLSYLKAFEAQVEVEKAKATINVAKVQAFEAQVKAFGTQVQAYEAIVKAATARADLQKNKVDIYKSEIEAMVGKINGQRALFEAYDARIRGESTKATLEETNTRAYAARVQAFGVRSELAIKRASLEQESNKQTLEWNIANMSRITAATGQQLQLIQARLATFQANLSRSTAKYSADKESKSVELQAQVSLSQVAIAKYQVMLEQWKTRSGEIIQYGVINAESLRAAGQMASNLASGAMAGTHVSAGISAGATAGQTSSRTSADNTTQARNVNESNQYSVTHSYAHRV